MLVFNCITHIRVVGRGYDWVREWLGVTRTRVRTGVRSDYTGLRLVISQFSCKVDGDREGRRR